MMQKPKKTTPHHDRHALRERPLLHQGQVPDDGRELGHVLLFVVVVVVVWGEIREKSSRSRERGREFLFSFESKIFIPVPKKKKQKRTSSHCALHGASVASIAVGGTSVHPGATVGVAQGPQAAASQLRGAGPVDGSVQVVVEVRTPL